MNKGCFYFIKDEYFSDFPDKKLMSNKERSSDGNLHNRPCFFAIYDKETLIYWLIPISSKVPKFELEYEKKKKQYGRCDTIVFGEMMGHKKAFLIQNMFPIIPSYIDNEYIDLKAKIPVRVDSVLEKELVSKATKVLAIVRNKNKKLILPDVLKIEKQLLEKLKVLV